MITYGSISFVMYVFAIVLANWLVEHVGLVPVGFGLVAPAGVYAAGVTFTCRNFTQLYLGRRFGFLAIAVGALVSLLISPRIELGGPLLLPLASGFTFAISETVDALVWTRLRKSGWFARAMGLGDLAGQVTDSAVFLTLAFGSVDFLAGQILGKQWTVWPVVIGMALLARHGTLLSRRA